MRSNGNGGLEISKLAISLISLLIILISSLVSAATTTASLGARMDGVEEKVAHNINKIDTLKDEAYENSKLLGEISKDIQYIKEQVDENHDDIKSLANQGR